MKANKGTKAIKASQPKGKKEHNIIGGIYNRMLINNNKWLSEINDILDKHFEIKKNQYWKVPLKSISLFGSKLCKIEQFWIVFINRMIKLKDNNSIDNIINAFTHSFSIVDEENISLLKTFYLKTIKQYSYSELIKYNQKKNKPNCNSNSNSSNNPDENNNTSNITTDDSNDTIQPYDPVPNSFCFKLIGINVSNLMVKRCKLTKTNETNLTIIPEYNNNDNDNKKSQRLMTLQDNKISHGDGKSDIASVYSNSQSNHCLINNHSQTQSQVIVSQSTIDRQEMFMSNIEKANKETEGVNKPSQSQCSQNENQLSLTQTLERLLDCNDNQA